MMPASKHKDKRRAWASSFSGRMSIEHLLGPRERKTSHLMLGLRAAGGQRTQPPTNASTGALRGQKGQVAVPPLPQRARQVGGLGTKGAVPTLTGPAWVSVKSLASRSEEKTKILRAGWTLKSITRWRRSPWIPVPPPPLVLAPLPSH